MVTSLSFCCSRAISRFRAYWALLQHCLVGGHTQFAGEEIQVSTWQQPQDYLDVPQGGKRLWPLLWLRITMLIH